MPAESAFGSQKTSQLDPEPFKYHGDIVFRLRAASGSLSKMTWIRNTEASGPVHTICVGMPNK